MSRRVIAAAIAAGALGLPAGARADEAAAEAAEAAETSDAPVAADRELGASLGVAVGGGVTPGGLRVEGRYLYQLSEDDWFDGRMAFTIGGGAAACFRDRADDVVCDHGRADGIAIDLGGGVRRWLVGQQGFAPWVGVSAALRLVRFGDDELTGVALPLAAAAGVRARVADRISVGGQAALEAGPALLGRGLGLEPQLGLVIGATVDVALP